jgi:hypothetical protein
MTEEQIALAKRAVACRGWRWMPGMLVHVGFRVVWVDETTFRSFDERGNEMYGSTDCLLPDLTDPATLGCLLALVREARGEPTYLPTCLDVHDEAWVVRPPGPWRQTRYESYASVLVAALEAAP